MEEGSGRDDELGSGLLAHVSTGDGAGSAGGSQGQLKLGLLKVGRGGGVRV